MSHGTKKFRGVTFKPGEIKSANGFINDPKMIRIDEPEVKIQPTTSTTTKSAAKTGDQKAEVPSK